VIFENPRVRKRRVFPGNFPGRLRLIERDFQKNMRARQQSRRSLGEDSAMDHQAIQPAIERRHWLIFTHASIQPGNLAGRNIGRIGHQQMKRISIYQLIQRCKEVPLLHRHAAGQPEPLNIFAGHANRGFADVGGDHHRLFRILCDCRSNTSASRAEVENPGRFQARLTPDELNHIFHQRLGIRAGDQYIARDLEFEIEKMGPASEISHRLLLGRAADKLAIRRQMPRLQNSLVIRIKLDSGNRQNMCQEQFSAKPRGINALSLEKWGRPLEKPPDRPYPFAFGHLGRIVHDRAISPRRFVA
jgi:hypothetical protein